MSIRGWRRHENAPDVAVRYIDGDGRLFHEQYVQDVEPIIEQNTALRNYNGGWAPDRSKRKVGTLPVTIVWDKIREWQAKGELPAHGTPGFSKELNRKLVELLKDRDYSKFRTVDRV